MIKISKRYSFDSAHQLHNPDWTEEENDIIFGKCHNAHGHTYGLVVEISGEVTVDDGMVMNYFELDKLMKPFIDSLDHKDLNTVFPNMITTSENMVGYIASYIRNLLLDATDGSISLESVTLSETPRTTATWVR